MLKIKTDVSRILELTANQGIVAFRGQKSANSDYMPALVGSQSEGWYYLVNYSAYGFGMPVDLILNVDGVKKGLKELEKELKEKGLHKIELFRLAQNFSGYELRKEAKAFKTWAEKNEKDGAFAAFKYYTAGMASPCFSKFWLGDQSKKASELCQDWQNFKPGMESSCRWQWIDYKEPISASQQFLNWASWQVVLAVGKHEHIF